MFRRLRVWLAALVIRKADPIRDWFTSRALEVMGRLATEDERNTLIAQVVRQPTRRFVAVINVESDVFESGVQTQPKSEMPN
jgi:hypothetical protein